MFISRSVCKRSVIAMTKLDDISRLAGGEPTRRSTLHCGNSHAHCHRPRYQWTCGEHLAQVTSVFQGTRDIARRCLLLAASSADASSLKSRHESGDQNKVREPQHTQVVCLSAENKQMWQSQRQSLHWTCLCHLSCIFTLVRISLLSATHLPSTCHLCRLCSKEW